MPKIVYSLDAINARLKAKGSKVALEMRGKGALSLRATLPAKPLSNRTGKLQQRIPINLLLPLPDKDLVPASIQKARDEILKRAEAEAEKLNSDLISNSFSWDKYEVRGTIQGTTVKDLISQFQNEYTKTNNIQERTWVNNWLRYLNYLPQEEPISESLLTNTIANSSKPNTHVRLNFCARYKTLAKFANIEVDFSKLEKRLSRGHKKELQIPSDVEIIEYRPLVSSENKSQLGWQWLYSVLFVAGLRPHEAFFCRWSDDGLEVLKGKTGARTVLYEIIDLMTPGLIEEWNLKQITLPSIDYETAYDDGSLGNKINTRFWKKKIKLNPYSLRHAFALRAMSNNVPVSVAAKMMGHSEQVHIKTYRKWLTDERSKEILSRLLKTKES